MIHVVRAHDGAAELLDHVAVLVGRLGGGERAEPATLAGEPGGGRLERLLPPDLVPAALAPDERARDPVAGVDEAGAEAALDAEHPLAREVRGDVVGHEGQAAVGPNGELEAAPDAAVRARRLDRRRHRDRCLLRPERAGRAGRDALAAGGADRRGHRPVADDADPHRVGAAEKRDGADPLDVAARDGAAAAEDAGLAVQDKEGLGVVDGKAVERGERGAADRVSGARGPELTEALAAGARAQHRAREVEHHRADADHLGGGRTHDHPLAHREVTGRRGSAPPLDLDEARAAGAERRAIGILAELGQRNAEPIHGVQDGRPDGDLGGLSVHHELHVALCPLGRRRGHPIIAGDRRRRPRRPLGADESRTARTQTSHARSLPRAGRVR